jgi:DNA polymerase III epsilon subunit family exonuclease
MLTNKPGKKLNEYVKDYVIFDLETTGISCNHDEVVEISAIKVLDGQVVEEFSTLVNPQRPIPFQASMVNGITDDMVADAPTFDVALKDFLEFVGDMILVGHNIHSFDMKFIWRDTRKYYDSIVGNDYIDTLSLARTYLPQMKHHTLTDLAAYYGIATDGAHRALFDCRMNQQVFEHLGEEMQHPSEDVKVCPRCGGALKLRNGKFGEFWGCSGYPECRYTRNK